MNLDNDSLQGDPSMAAARAELELGLGCAILTPAAAPCGVPKVCLAYELR